MPYIVKLVDGEPVVDRCSPDVEGEACDIALPTVFRDADFDSAQALQAALEAGKVITPEPAAD